MIRTLLPQFIGPSPDATLALMEASLGSTKKVTGDITEIAKVISTKFPDFSIEKTLGKGKFSTAYLINSLSERYVLKLTSIDNALDQKAHDPIFGLNARRIGGEWLALLRYGPFVLSSDYALYYDHTSHTFHLMSSEEFANIFSDPEKRKNINFTLVGTLSKYSEGAQDLVSYVCKRGSLSIEEIRVFARQLLQAVASIHELGINHRDIKPDNILFKDGKIQLIDFGISRLEKTKHKRRKSCCGTMGYMAPEINPPSEYTKKVDIYSTAMVIQELAQGENLGSEFSQFIERLSAPQDERPTAQEALQLPFVSVDENSLPLPPLRGSRERKRENFLLSDRDSQ